MKGPKPNYGLRGTVTDEFYSPSDGAALSKAINIVMKREHGVSELYFKGKAVDEPLFRLEKTEKVLCQVGRLS